MDLQTKALHTHVCVCSVGLHTQALHTKPRFDLQHHIQHAYIIHTNIHTYIARSDPEHRAGSSPSTLLGEAPKNL